MAAVVGICSFLFPFLYHVASTGQEGWYDRAVPFNAIHGRDTAVLVLKLHSFAYFHSKGVGSLLLPVNAMLFFCLLQSWLPSLVNYGFVYLTQCWFLSCLTLYWLHFYRIYGTEVFLTFNIGIKKKSQVVVVGLDTNTLVLKALDRLRTITDGISWHPQGTQGRHGVFLP